MGSSAIRLTLAVAAILFLIYAQAQFAEAANLYAPSVVSYKAVPTTLKCGNAVAFETFWNDDGNSVKLFVCKARGATATGCTKGQWCKTANSSANPISCSYTIKTTDGTGRKPYYLYVCDVDGCSQYKYGEFTIEKSSTCTCSNECQKGATRCTNATNGSLFGYSQVCGNYDSDSCYDWPYSTSARGSTLCSKGCSNGSCIVPCARQWKCKDAYTKALQVPDYLGNCMWLDSAACQYGCIDGNCNQAPTCSPITKCYDSLTLGYQISNCSWINLTACQYGCEGNQCRTTETTERWNGISELSSYTDGLHSASNPVVAVDGNTIHAAWADYNQTESGFFYRRSTDQGAIWSGASKIISTPSSIRSLDMVADSNRVNIVWTDIANIYYTRKNNGSSSWDTTKILAAYSSSSVTRVSTPVIAARGNSIVVAWSADFVGAYAAIYYTISRDAGVTWSSPMLLAQGTSDDLANISVAVSNKIHAVWAWADESWTNENKIHYKNSSDFGATWSSDRNIFEWYQNSQILIPVLKILADGNSVHIAFLLDRYNDFDEGTYYLRSIDAGQNWQQAKRISTTWSSAYEPDLSIAGNRVAITWRGGPQGNDVYYAESSDNGTAWSIPFRLTRIDNAVAPSIVVSPALAVIVWGEMGSYNGVSASEIAYNLCSGNNCTSRLPCTTKTVCARDSSVKLRRSSDCSVVTKIADCVGECHEDTANEAWCCNPIKGCNGNYSFLIYTSCTKETTWCEYGCSIGTCNSPPCSNECSSEQLRCNGSYSQSCGNYDADSCYEWPSSISGDGNTYCSYGCNAGTGQCNPSSCTSECGSGETRCNGSYSQVCSNYDADGCLEWPLDTSGAGNTYCTNDCSAGQCIICTSHVSSACYGNNLYWHNSCGQREELKQDCGESSCGSWGSNYCKNGDVYHSRTCYDKDCAGSACYSNPRTEEQIVQNCNGLGCSNGQCNPSYCTDGCSSGQTRCNGSYKQTCDNYDSDPCLEWPSGTSGSGNTYCSYGCNSGAGQCNPVLSISISPINSTVNSGVTQMFTVSPSGGTDSYLYSWSLSSYTNCTTTGSASSIYSVICSNNGSSQISRTVSTIVTSGSQTKTASTTMYINPAPSNGDLDYCSSTTRCYSGQGDCDDDTQCQPGLKCVFDTGSQYGLYEWVDVCKAVSYGCHSGAPGSIGFCSSTCLCGPGEGNCDSNAECQSGLICATGVGVDYGWDSTVNVCQPPGTINQIIPWSKFTAEPTPSQLSSISSTATQTMTVSSVEALSTSSSNVGRFYQFPLVDLGYLVVTVSHEADDFKSAPSSCTDVSILQSKLPHLGIQIWNAPKGGNLIYNLHVGWYKKNSQDCILTYESKSLYCKEYCGTGQKPSDFIRNPPVPYPIPISDTQKDNIIDQHDLRYWDPNNHPLPYPMFSTGAGGWLLLLLLLLLGVAICFFGPGVIIIATA